MISYSAIPLVVSLILWSCVRRGRAIDSGPLPLLYATWGSLLLLMTIFFSDYPFPLLGAVLIALFLAGPAMGWYAVGAYGQRDARTTGRGCVPECALAPRPPYSNKKFEMALFCTFCTIGAIAVPALPMYAGTATASLADTVVSTASHYTSSRYADASFREPALVVFCSIFLYAGALLGGYLHRVNRAHRWRALYWILPAGIALVITILLTTRATLVYTVFLFISSNFASINVTGGSVRLVTLGRVMAMTVLLPALSIGYLGVQYLRDPDIFSDPYGGLRLASSTLLGSIAALSSWLSVAGSELFVISSPSFGSRTISGVVTMATLGFDRGQPERYADFVLGVSINEFTNVYTVFRDLIEDFSISLAFAIAVAFGAASRVVPCVVSSISIPILSVMILISINSFVTSPLRFTTIIGSFILFILSINIGRIARVILPGSPGTGPRCHACSNPRQGSL